MDIFKIMVILKSTAALLRQFFNLVKNTLDHPHILFKEKVIDLSKICLVIGVFLSLWWLWGGTGLLCGYLAFYSYYAAKYWQKAKFYKAINETDYSGKIYPKEAILWSGRPIREAAQGQQVIAEGDELLGTGHVLQCNLLTGWCKELKLTFLCHADLPMSVRGLSLFFERLDELVGEEKERAEVPNVKDKSVFKLVIFGGQTWWLYPYMTRLRLIEKIENANLNHVSFDLELAAMPTSFREFSFSQCANSGLVDGYYNSVRVAKRSSFYLHESDACFTRP